MLAVFEQPPDCGEYPKRPAASSRVPGSGGQVAAIERQEPLPMPLGGITMIDRPFRKREAMMGAGIDFDLRVGTLHSLHHLFDDFHGRVDIRLGARKIELG